MIRLGIETGPLMNIQTIMPMSGPGSTNNENRGITRLCTTQCQLYRLIGQVGKVFANGPGDQGSIPGRVIPKTLKIELDTSLLNTQQYKARIKGKVKLSRERNSARWPPWVVFVFFLCVCVLQHAI